MDARNHGDSPHSSNMSYKDMAGDMIQLLKDLGFKKAVLVGHSMGGSAVMYTALNFPQHVKKLVVVDMSPVRTSPNLMQMERIFEAMRLVMVDGSFTLSKARKTVDQQLSKSIKSSSMRQVTFLLVLFYFQHNACFFCQCRLASILIQLMLFSFKKFFFNSLKRYS